MPSTNSYVKLELSTALSIGIIASIAIATPRAVASHTTHRGPVAASATHPAQRSPEDAVIQQYCLGCHSGSAPDGDFSLAHLSAADSETDARFWEKALVKVHAGLMPPAGAPRPSRAVLTRLTSAIEQQIDHAAASASWAKSRRS